MNESTIELGKRLAAENAVKDNIKPNMIVGIGSGSTVVYAVNKIAQMNRLTDLNLKCIPTSFQSYQLILNNDLPLATLNQYPEIDLTIDGADELDTELNAIKGGGGCLVQEKIIASNSKKYIIIADYRKNSSLLGENWKRGIPIEIIPMAYIPLLKKLEKLGAKPILRMANAKSGPLVTDNGNFIIDADFGIVKNPKELDEKIRAIPGVIETGLFIGMISKAYIGLKDGNVSVLSITKV